MASIFSRMSMIVRSNINDLLDNFEDPAKMVDQTIIDAKEEYAKVRKESLSVLANETTTKKELDRLSAEADRWHGIAASAMRANNEEDARKALEKEQDIRSKVTMQEKTYTAARSAADKLRAKLDDMGNEIKDMEDKSAQIKAMAVTAKATKAANRVANHKFDDRGFEAFDRMQEKAEKELAEAEALDSLNTTATEKEEQSLEEKYASGGPASIDDALTALKAEVGK